MTEFFMSYGTQPRWLSIWFPRFAMDRLIAVEKRAQRFRPSPRPVVPLEQREERGNNGTRPVVPSERREAEEKHGTRPAVPQQRKEAQKSNGARPVVPSERKEAQRQTNSETPAESSFPHREQSAENTPRVIVELSAHGPRITAANQAGFRAGARIGQRLHDARAACPAMKVDYADPDADAMALERLANFALRFSPIVAPDGLTATDAGLMLDIAGCAHLFSGEQVMVDQVVARFTKLGFLTLAGLAPTPLAARVLARYGDDPDDDIPPPILACSEDYGSRSIDAEQAQVERPLELLGDPAQPRDLSFGSVPSARASPAQPRDISFGSVPPARAPAEQPPMAQPRDLALCSVPAEQPRLFDPACLDAFPIEALQLDDDRITLLTRLGLKTIGSVRKLPRIALERRFRSKKAAQSVQRRLDQLTGAVTEPITPLRPPEPYRTTLRCPEPILDSTGIEWALRDMLVRLETRLDREGLGARRFRLFAFTVDGSSSQVAVQLSSAGRAHAMLLRLFEERLEAIDPGFGIEAFVLSAENTEPIAPAQTGWVPTIVPGSHHQEAFRLDEDVLALVDRLANRFGTHVSYQLKPVAAHLPEEACRLVAVGASVGSDQIAGALSKAPLSWSEWEASASHTAPRPTRLLDRPEPADVVAAVPDGPPAQLVWRRVRRGIVRARGPERIAAPWWQYVSASPADKAWSKFASPAAVDATAEDGQRPPSQTHQGPRIRDYYDVEDEEGRRYWVFRSGLYDDDQTGETPRWFVHGLFQ
ncbi:MAG: DNA polymerase Y family protein [Pseudomonadota bacterium]